MNPLASAPTIAIGDPAPGFAGLLGAAGGSYSLATFDEAGALALIFVGNGCPTVRLYEQRLAEVHGTFAGRGLQVVLVNSNNPHLSPPDTFDRMVERAAHSALPFPYLKDPDSELARACGATCTPHAFVFDGGRRLAYRGRIDDSRTGSRVTTDDLANAIGAVLAGRPVRTPETQPFGCAIVW